MSRDFTPAVPPGWELRFAGTNLTLLEYHNRYGTGIGAPRNEPCWLVDPLGGQHPLWLNDAERSYLLLDSSVAKIIACGIVPWGDATCWTKSLLESSWHALMPVRRALVAPRPRADVELLERVGRCAAAIDAAVSASCAAHGVMATCYRNNCVPSSRDLGLFDSAIEPLRDAQRGLREPVVGVAAVAA